MPTRPGPLPSSGRIIQPSGDVIIASEAASPHHAWVVGALESVINGVYTWLGANKYSNPHFGVVREMIEVEDKENPFVSLPPYLSKKVSEWASVVSMIHREEILKTRGKKTEGVKDIFSSFDSLEVSAAA